MSRTSREHPYAPLFAMNVDVWRGPEKGAIWGGVDVASANLQDSNHRRLARAPTRGLRGQSSQVLPNTNASRAVRRSPVSRLFPSPGRSAPVPVPVPAPVPVPVTASVLPDPRQSALPKPTRPPRHPAHPLRAPSPGTPQNRRRPAGRDGWRSGSASARPRLASLERTLRWAPLRCVPSR